MSQSDGRSWRDSFRSYLENGPNPTYTHMTELVRLIREGIGEFRMLENLIFDADGLSGEIRFRDGKTYKIRLLV